ncbi:MAG TPA: DUF2889 domain-containing protein [Acetobacteraceae bacterium]|nr:DUF2889 domain-containing protein [Acetobacteraceae bacterium]
MAVALSEPVARKMLHQREITLRGYEREDGLFDIEAHLVDTKTYGFPSEDRGFIEPGEPLHGMWMRMTVDDHLTITACEASTEYAPYTVCPQAAPNFARLAGLRIGKGFLKGAAERIGGDQGCTHLRELLQQMATVAFQTLYPVRRRREQEEAARRENEGAKLDSQIIANFGGAPALLNTCLAYGAGSPVVKRRWPHLYTGN